MGPLPTATELTYSGLVGEDAYALEVEAALGDLLEGSEQEALVRYQLALRYLRSLGVAPGRLEQCQALEEIYLGQTAFPLEDLAAEAAGLHYRYRKRGFTRGPVEPSLLAATLRYLVEPDSSISEGRSEIVEDRIYLRHAVLEDPQDVAFQVLHEIAEARIGHRGSHADVQILTALLAVERGDVRPKLKHGTGVATRLILQEFSHVPQWLLAVSVLLRAEK